MRVPVLLSTTPARVLVALIGAVLAAGAISDRAGATTTIPTTTYSTNTSWTAAGSPYVINGNVTVASGATLTIQPGVIVKFAYQAGVAKKITINSGAAINAAGTAASPIYLTSIKDDAIGGDTGGDGPSTCSANNGGYVEVQSSSSSNVISHAFLRCGPPGSGKTSAPIRVTGPGAQLTASYDDFIAMQFSSVYVDNGATLNLDHATINYPASLAVGVMVGTGGTAYVTDSSVLGTGPSGSAGQGIRVEDGSIDVERTTLTNLNFGVTVNLSSTFAGMPSSFYDDDIHDNNYGVYVSAIGTGGMPPNNELPWGHRNNIYNNVNSGTLNAQQLTAGSPVTGGADWSDNYWGPTAYWQANPDGCPDQGYVAYPGTTPTSPVAPTREHTYFQSLPFPSPGVYCNVPYYYLGDGAGWSPVPFGTNTPYLTSDETLGGLNGPWARNGGHNGLLSDPVMTATGNFVHQETDLKLAGTGVPFKLVRSYNSLDTRGGPLGARGWTFNLGASLTIDYSGDVTFRSDDGAVYQFEKNRHDPAGSYITSPGFGGTFEAISGGYRATTHAGIVYRFDSTGKLTSITDRNGEGLTLAYTGGNLSSVTDSASRTVTFSYNGSGQLASIALPDGRGVSYGYTNGLLTSVLDARGKSWTYTYNAQNLLTKERDPLLHDVFTNVYDSTTRRITGTYDALSNHTTFAWDATTQTATTTDPLGKQTIDVYAHNLLVSRTDPLGHKTGYAYDSAGNTASVTTPRGNVSGCGCAANYTTSYTYDGNGNVLAKTAPTPLSFTESWTYNAFDEPLTYTNGRGKQWTYTYDTVGNLLSKTAPGGDPTTFSYYSSGLLHTVTDPRGNASGCGCASDYTTTYGYDSAGNLTSKTEPAPLGYVTTYGYDSSGRLTSVVDPRGNVSGANPSDYMTSVVYDDADHRTSVTDAFGKATTFGYDDDGRLHSVANALGKQTTYSYDAAGNLWRTTAPNATTIDRAYTVRGELASVTDAGHETSYTYDGAGRLHTKVMPRGNVSGATPADYAWTYEYDADGNLRSASDPLGHETDYSYDALDQRTGVTDALSHSTSYAYDDAGNLSSVTDPLSHTTGYGYDDRNELVSTTDGRGKETDYGYDAAGNLTSAIDLLGNETTYAYDALNRRLTMVDPRGNLSGATPSDYQWSYGYDAAGELTTISDPLGDTTIRAYDRDGRLQSVTDPLSHSTSYAYDDLGRLTSITAADGTVDSSVTSYGYDDNTNDLTSRTDGNLHTTSYAYNADHQLTSVTNPLGKVWTFGYDADGNLTSTVDAIANAASNAALGTTTYSYDHAGRMVGIVYSDSTPDVAITYDYANRKIQMTDGAGAESYGYDNANRLTSVTRGSSAFAYQYDAANNLTQTTFPDSTVVGYGYDNAEQLSSMTQGSDVTSYGYDAAGHLTSKTLPNGIAEDRSYDPAGRLTELSNTTSSHVYTDDALTLDAAGNPTRVDRAGGNVETFTYDSLNRLTGVCYQASCPSSFDPHTSWTYDAVGNRMTQSGATGSSSTTYSYNDADQLTSSVAGSSTTTYGYDDDGRETAKTGSSYAYDMAGRMTSTTTGSTTTSYSYDGSGNRLGASDGTNTTNYLWDENALGGLAQLARESDGSGSLIRRYITDSEGPASMQNGSGSFYYLRDYQGSIAQLTDASADTQWQYAYGPFGDQRTATKVDPSAPDNPLRFDGQLLDDASGLYDLRARQYDPVDGRFASTDPLSPALTDPYVSAYVYAGDRPTVLADPSGLLPGLGDVFHYGGEALHYAGVGLSYANTVGERIVGSVVDSVVSSVESPYECVAGLIEGEYRNAAPACLKTAALAALLVLPGGLELSAGRDVVGSWLERLVYEERGSIFAGEEAPSIKAGAAGGETAGRKFAPSVRQTALNRNPSTCVYCRMETNSPQVDHAIPRARGGDATLENAQTTCRHCNASKGMRDYPRSPPPGYRGPWPPPWWQR